MNALHVLDQNWATFDSAAGARDQYLRREDLQAILNNPNASSMLKDAARFLLQHPEYFNRLEMAAGVGGKDGIVGHGDVKAELNAARKEAATYGREVESGGDGKRLETLEAAGKLKRITFTDRDAMKKLVDPVMAAYAKEIGAEQILAKINAIK